MTWTIDSLTGLRGANLLLKSGLAHLGIGGSSDSQSSSSNSQRHASRIRQRTGKASRANSLSPDNTATVQRSGGGEQPDREAVRKEAWERGKHLAQELRILDRFAQDVARTGVVGEERAAKLIYLVVTTRLFEKPVSAAVKGPSAAGKSNLLGNVLRFFPDSAYHTVTSMSDMALVYSNVSLKHRFLVIMEAEGLKGGTMAYLVRSLLSEGRISHETVEEMKPKILVKEGPTGLLVTTTATSLHRELETRLLSIPVDDSAEQTRRVILAAADGAVREPIDFVPWQAYQIWLEGGEHRVFIPYAHRLAEMIPKVAVRMRRDFSALLRLIEAHAVLHRESRERDAEGRIIAMVEDYAVVRQLVADLIGEGVEATVSATVRETVEAVKRLRAKLKCGVSLRPLSEALGLDKSTVSRRVSVAIGLGYLRDLEERSGRLMRLVLAEPLPENLEVLPPPEALADGR